MPDPWWHGHTRRGSGAWSEFRALCGRPWSLGIAHVSSGSSHFRYRADAIWNADRRRLPEARSRLTEA